MIGPARPCLAYLVAPLGVGERVCALGHLNGKSPLIADDVLGVCRPGPAPADGPFCRVKIDSIFQTGGCIQFFGEFFFITGSMVLSPGVGPMTSGLTIMDLQIIKSS